MGNIIITLNTTELTLHCNMVFSMLLYISFDAFKTFLLFNSHFTLINMLTNVGFFKP